MNKIKEKYKKIQPDDGLKNDILKHVIESEPKPTRLFLIKRAAYVLTIIVGVFVVNNLASNHIDNTPAPNEQEDAQEVVVVPEDPGQTDTIKDKEPISNETTEEMIRNEHPTASIIETNQDYELVLEMSESGGMGLSATSHYDIRNDIDMYPSVEDSINLPVLVNPHYTETMMEPQYIISTQDLLNDAEIFINRFGLDTDSIEVESYGYSTTINFVNDNIEIRSDYLTSYKISIYDIERFVTTHNLDSFPDLSSESAESIEKRLNWVLESLGISNEYRVYHDCDLNFLDEYICVESFGSLYSEHPQQQVLNNLLTKIKINASLVGDIEGDEIYDVVIELPRAYTYESIGEFPIISQTQAHEKLLRGDYASLYQHDYLDEADIYLLGINYYESYSNRLLIPVYTFRVDLEKVFPDLSDYYLSTMYGFYHVPAIEGTAIVLTFN